MRFGVEHNYISNRNTLIARGDQHIFASGGEFVVHPAVREDPHRRRGVDLRPQPVRLAVRGRGGRVAAILLVARIARRMTRSNLLGCAAGLLLSLDGLEFVMSRTALLDIFVMFWVLAAFGCLVVDRDRTRSALADAGGPAAPRQRPAPAGVPLVVAGRRGVPGAGLRLEVERRLVRARVHRADPRLGCRRAAGGRVRGPGSGPGRPRDSRAARRAGGGARIHLPGHLDRVVRVQHRLRPQLGGPARDAHPGHLGPGVALRVPQGDAGLQYRPHHPPPLPVQAVDLAGDVAAGLLLLVPHLAAPIRPAPGTRPRRCWPSARR